MDDALAEAQQGRVMAIYGRWGRPLGLGYQRAITFSWYRGAIPDYEQAALVVDVDWQYKSARIKVDLCKVVDLTDADLEWAVVHELCHVFLGGLVDAHRLKVDRDAFRLIEEHTASTLAQAMLWLREHCTRTTGEDEDG